MLEQCICEPLQHTHICIQRVSVPATPNVPLLLSPSLTLPLTRSASHIRCRTFFWFSPDDQYFVAPQNMSNWDYRSNSYNFSWSRYATAGGSPLKNYLEYRCSLGHDTCGGGLARVLHV